MELHECYEKFLSSIPQEIERDFYRAVVVYMVRNNLWDNDSDMAYYSLKFMYNNITEQVKHVHEIGSAEYIQFDVPRHYKETRYTAWTEIIRCLSFGMGAIIVPDHLERQVAVKPRYFRRFVPINRKVYRPW